MKKSVKKGFGFGLTSGIITTLGLIVGLHSGTHSKMIILAGIITIAIADAFSDSLGMHMSEEFERHKSKEVWESTFSTFFSKLIFASIFIIPVLLLQLTTAIIVSVALGLSLIALFSFYIAKQQNRKPLKIISEHLLIAVLVVIVTHYTGAMIANIL